MSLQFYIGASGTGKSTTVYKEVLKRAKEEPFRRFFVIVPDQFTMQTQKVLCHLSEHGGILNVEVLSFGRLAHRIFEELGLESLPKLDDTGKNLILRKVAADCEKQLSVVGANMKKIGYIAQVKSMISEFAQYGILPDDLTKFCEQAKEKGNLSAKLSDLQILYRGYKNYIADKFITTEESMDVLVKNLHRSALIRDSVVVFDGFTGFTPIQERLLQEMMLLCRQVIVTLLGDTKEDLSDGDITQSMYYLTAKAYRRLCKIAADQKTERDKDIVLTKRPAMRFANRSGLAHLEQNLFRPHHGPKVSSEEQISLIRCTNPKAEIDWVCLTIRHLIRENGYCYRDFAVITGDLEAYGQILRESFAEQDIPLFLDQNKSLLFHPLMVFLLGIMKVLTTDFSYDAVMELLRVGYFDLQEEQIDLFETFILSRGIRGKRKYQTSFIGMENSEMGSLAEEADEVRKELISCLQPFLNVTDKNARNYTRLLYNICVRLNLEEKLQKQADDFWAKNMPARAKEYEQVYGAVMTLFDQIYALLDEEMALDEYGEILKAGFAELKVGSIPQSVDQVIAGDLERTRLKPIKVLFIVGVNDGIIPGHGSSGGILSDLERTFLTDLGAELAPTPRQKSFEERLYLYMNMTQPSEKLVLSFSEVDEGGNQLRPSYLIHTVSKLFSDLEVMTVTDADMLRMVESEESGLKLLARLMREYVSGIVFHDSEEWNKLLSLAEIFEDQEIFGKLLDAAFFQYHGGKLPEDVAKALFGEKLYTSVSRLETYSACAYAHFLKYGLKLKEEETFDFSLTDLGNLYHDTLYQFGNYLSVKGYDWNLYKKEEADAFVDDAVERFAKEYRNTVLLDTARNEALKERTKDILKTTLDSLSYQLGKGDFVPADYELKFQYMENPRLYGSIDRLDIAQDENGIYVKILDYKSGKHSFDIARLYYGLDLQLSVYMNGAVAAWQKKNPDKKVIPCACFFYEIADPMPVGDTTENSLERRERIHKELRVQGLILENDEVLKHLDSTQEAESSVIPVKYKKNGELASASQTATAEQFELIRQFTDAKVRKIGQDIRNGKIDINPVMEQSAQSSCQYCAYKGICGFDKKLPGYKEREMLLKGDQVYEEIKKELTEDGIYDRSEKGHNDSKS
ncbi:MAG: exodeoxyribonuclease V subunit gamma [Lachnospiraceae bacterium]|nr:exodeoxyribonuclease V subunit gamma [Lachnospiraceae bacterium]